ncbi:MAG: GAF domain-containing protein [Synechococcales cyanobacterium C42_A2020_086]|nr:GAF domain-containing protein [Synechococcales cyanobacterium C42_A2020_086]
MQTSNSSQPVRRSASTAASSSASPSTSPKDIHAKPQSDPLLNPNPENRRFGQASLSPPEWVLQFMDQIRRAETREALLETTVTEIRQSFQADRVLIYRFRTESQGTVLAESLVEGYTPMQGEWLPAIAFGAGEPSSYQQLPFVALHNPAEATLTPHQWQLLERFQVQASLSLPIWLEGQLWGLLVVQQCVKPRYWQEAEIALLHSIITELRLQFQSLGFRREQQVLARVTDTMRETMDLDTILQSVSREARQFLQVERVAICQFRSDDAAEVVAESKRGEWTSMMGRVWTDPHLRQQGGRLRHPQTLIIEDVARADRDDCDVSRLENFEIRACAITPIFAGETLWGVLWSCQHSSPRQWTDPEVQFLDQISNQLGLAIQRGQLFQEKLAAETYKEELPAILHKMSNASYIQTICQTAVQEIRRLLNVERVCIYRFRPDYFGDFIYESESGGFPPLVGSAWEDTYVQQHQGGRLRNQEPFTADNIYTAGLSDCHVAALEHFGVKAFVVVAIKQGEKLWGLLSAFQHSGPRHWLETEINMLTDMGRQLGASLQQADYLAQLQEQASQMAKAAQINRSVADVIPKILQSPDLDTLVRVTTQSVRRLLKCDRIAIYRFQPDWSSTLIGASGMKPGEDGPDSELGPLWPDTHLQDTQGGPYRHRQSLVVNNIHVVGHSLDEIERLQEFGVQAYVTVPIFNADQLWGVLSAYQTSESRSWTEAEIHALNQIAVQISVAMQQIEYLQQLQRTSAELAKTAEREQLISRIVERIRQSLDLQKAFKTTAKEIRSFLNVDRVAVFRFKPGSGYNRGEIVAEDLQPGCVSALGAEVDDHCFGERYATLYQQGQTWAIADVEQANLQECYLETLARFQVRANLVVPLLKGEELWGLFCIHQCSGPRHWQAADIEFAKQIAAQLNVAIQQGEYVEQLQQQAEQKELIQQQVIQLLVAVRPALEGDLTVRAPVTDNEVGTIADAYNNTLGSLRQIVSQMLAAASQVTQTSQASESAIAQLTSQATAQSQALNQALERVQTILASTRAVEANSQQVEAAVQQANQTVMTGDATIDRTVDEMQNIRETVTEADERLQRLSESVQKIARVLNLIRNFTTQTQLLALNASIEATRAGEYGRGFAVVANEVRSLARQSADAATDIEELVQEIQAGMAEVSTAMETGIDQVESGTQVVTEARQSLNAIVSATSQISQLISGITQATQDQTQQVQLLTHTVADVAAIADKTSEDSAAIAASFKDLLTMAEDLQAKSNQFKVI